MVKDHLCNLGKLYMNWVLWRELNPESVSFYSIEHINNCKPYHRAATSKYHHHGSIDMGIRSERESGVKERCDQEEMEEWDGGRRWLWSPDFNRRISEVWDGLEKLQSVECGCPSSARGILEITYLLLVFSSSKITAKPPPKWWLPLSLLPLTIMAVAERVG